MGPGGMNDSRRENAVSALLVGAFESDRHLVRKIFQQAGWQLLEAQDRRQALEHLERVPVQVVVAESRTAGWDWKHILSDLRRMAHPPQLVVTSRMADEHLWAEVLNVGGYDVLAQPLDRDEVERVLTSASRNFQRKPMAAAAPLALTASVA
jgi:DNA-binding response OmpR family regulator